MVGTYKGGGIRGEVGFALQFAFGVILIVVKFHEFFGREYFVKYFMK